MTRYDALVISRKQLGDVLLLQPALEFLTRRGERRVALSTRPRFVDMLTLMPGPVALAPQWFPRAGTVYCLESKPAALLYAAQIAGARKHLCLTRDTAPWWHKLIFHQKLIVSSRESYRAAVAYAMCGGPAEAFKPPRLHAPPQDWRPAGLPNRYRVVHPTAAWPSKVWSARNWVAGLSTTDQTCPWVITSGPSPWEITVADEIAAGLGKRAINLAGRTDLREFLAVLAGADMTLCVDGSASHLSSAFGRPTLTLFGPTNPIHWHWPTPLSPRLWAEDFVAERKPPVDAIPVEAMVAATHELLGRIHG